jgi:hypothetical protein
MAELLDVEGAVAMIDAAKFTIRLDEYVSSGTAPVYLE